MSNKEVQYYRNGSASIINLWVLYRGQWWGRSTTGRWVEGPAFAQIGIEPDEVRFCALYARLKNFYFDPKVIFKSLR